MSKQLKKKNLAKEAVAAAALVIGVAQVAPALADTSNKTARPDSKQEETTSNDDGDNIVWGT
jgi:hypothetical protein